MKQPVVFSKVKLTNKQNGNGQVRLLYFSVMSFILPFSVLDWNDMITNKEKKYLFF